MAGVPSVPPSRGFRIPALRSRWPRRLRIHRSGWAVCTAALVLGVSAIATGNNLLFLLLGGMLGLIGLSGWMSEQVLRNLEVRRLIPGGVIAGEPARIVYEVTKRGSRIPSLALELAEPGLPGLAFIPVAESGITVRGHLDHTFPSRGIHPLEQIVLRTGFPFGLFSKERDVPVTGEVVVWPRLDRAVRELWPTGRRMTRNATTVLNATGARGEFRSLRDYRPGDDPRDVHWRSSARRSTPVVREFERDGGETLWICMDLAATSVAAGDAAAETAAALAVRASSRGEAFGLLTAEAQVSPGSGTAQLERVLDALARARFRVNGPAAPRPPDGAEGVLVTASAGAIDGWAAVLVAEAES